MDDVSPLPQNISDTGGTLDQSVSLNHEVNQDVSACFYVRSTNMEEAGFMTSAVFRPELPHNVVQTFSGVSLSLLWK